jgi:hypothetical protein
MQLMGNKDSSLVFESSEDQVFKDLGSDVSVYS